MKKIQRLSHAKIVDAEGNVITGAEAVEKLANSNIVESTNQMLSNNPSLLNEWEAKEVIEMLNYILSGSGRAICDGVEEDLKPGVMHICPQGHRHSIVNTGEDDLVMLTIVVKR